MSESTAPEKDINLNQLLKSSMPATEVAGVVGEYNRLHDDDRAGTEERSENYTSMVNAFYDLVTDFYEYGWGSSFHFAVRFRNETLASAIARHEHFVALRLGLKRNARVLDVGCGVGGPMREIARFAECRVVGINNNAYQIKRGESHNKREGLERQCSFIKGDFMHIPEPEAAFDAAYALEATCHAPDAVACYAEVARVLKPGAYFAGYEWSLTAAYDPENAEHRAIKKGIEVGNGLPDIRTMEEVEKALVAAGFELIDSRDVAPIPEDSGAATWYQPLEGEVFSFANMRSSILGRWFTHTSLGVMERIGAVPAGSQAVSDVLQTAAAALIQGGKSGTFTPMHFFLARKL